ncbi:MAG: hypothetical protein NZ702_02065 [Gammaproteobacteria bacterium]|nr:hypothetical protein [Gammaproteobacteria bacterium]
MKKILLTTLAVFTLSVQAFHAPKTAVSFETVIGAAEADYKKALAARMAWRDTGKMIKEAKKLHKAGKVDIAIAVAKKAHKQAVNALAQAAVAGSAGPRF